MAARGVRGLIAVSALMGLTACGSATTGSAEAARRPAARARDLGAGQRELIRGLGGRRGNAGGRVALRG